MYTFAITRRDDGRVDPWLYNRFDRTTINRTFYQGDKFQSDYASDFTMIVSDVTTLPAAEQNMDGSIPTTINWASNAEADVSPDRVQLANLAPFLTAIANGEVPPLAQGDDAAPAAGLKEMKMGFGGDGGMGGMEELGAKKKAKKGKKKSKAKKDEL